MHTELYVLGLYTGLLGLIYFGLVLNVIRVKRAEKIFMGDDGNLRVIRALRGQMNFIETIPFILIILLLAVLLDMPIFLVHIAGIMLVVGRFFHAVHFIKSDAPYWQRFGGFALTFLVFLLGSISLIAHGICAIFL